MTRAFYQEYLEVFKQTPQSRWCRDSSLNIEEDKKHRPIRNIFKMSRVMVDPKELKRLRQGQQMKEKAVNLGDEESR
jgi:hypothetical protein